jgi:hypothetical protein
MEEDYYWEVEDWEDFEDLGEDEVLEDLPRTKVFNQEQLLSMDFMVDNFKICLMDTTYPDPNCRSIPSGYEDIKDSTLPEVNGYSECNLTLDRMTRSKGRLEWRDVSWQASGGNIGPTGGAIIYNDSQEGKPIVAYIDFGQKVCQHGESYFGGKLTITGLEIRANPGVF